MITREQVKAFKLPEEVLEVPALGGSVIVRGMGFGEMMKFASGLSEGDVAHVARLLAATVFLGDGEPLYSAAEWEAFGASHSADMVVVYNAAIRLSGLNGEAAEKK